MRRAWVGAPSCAMIGLLLAGGARADEPSAPDRALAEALFREGRQLMESGHVPEACAKLAESQRIDPAIGTLLNLATCHALEGRTATAWAEFVDARTQARSAGRDKYVSFAQTQMNQLEPRLSRVVLGMDRPPDGIEIGIDQQTLGAGALGSPLPLDPGKHTLRLAAPGRAPETVTITVGAEPGVQRVRHTLRRPRRSRPAAASRRRHPGELEADPQQ